MDKRDWLRLFYEHLNSALPQDEKRPKFNNGDIIDFVRGGDMRKPHPIYVTREGEKIIVETSAGALVELFADVSLVCVYRYLLSDWNGSTTDIFAGIHEKDGAEWLVFRYTFDVAVDMETNLSRYITVRLSFTRLLAAQLAVISEQIRQICK